MNRELPKVQSPKFASYVLSMEEMQVFSHYHHFHAEHKSFAYLSYFHNYQICQTHRVASKFVENRRNETRHANYQKSCGKNTYFDIRQFSNSYNMYFVFFMAKIIFSSSYLQRNKHVLKLFKQPTNLTHILKKADGMDNDGVNLNHKYKSTKFLPAKSNKRSSQYPIMAFVACRDMILTSLQVFK